MKRFTFLDCEVRSICNAARVTFPHFSTLLRYETNVIVIEEEIDSRQLVRTSVFLVLSRHLRGLPCNVRHARTPCSFHMHIYTYPLLCAYTKRIYADFISISGQSKSTRGFPAVPTFKHNLERSNAINLKREGNGGLFSGVLRP